MSSSYNYHLTHRCHDRKFLLKFAKDRDRYRQRLREAILKHKLSLLSYNITSNHVHLIAFSDHVEQIALVMQSAAGEFARDYNRRKQRSGAFWEGRYHATIVAGGQYLWECLIYVELNMVRCEVAGHPADWDWSGYQELMGYRRRNRLLDVNKLLELLGNPPGQEFRKNLEHALTERMAKDQTKREAKWTQSLAVGSEDFVKQLEPEVRNRQHTECVADGNHWVLKENMEHFPLPKTAP